MPQGTPIRVHWGTRKILMPTGLFLGGLDQKFPDKAGTVAFENLQSIEPKIDIPGQRLAIEHQEVELVHEHLRVVSAAIIELVACQKAGSHIDQGLARLEALDVSLESGGIRFTTKVLAIPGADEGTDILVGAVGIGDRRQHQIKAGVASTRGPVSFGGLAKDLVSLNQSGIEVITPSRDQISASVGQTVIGREPLEIAKRRVRDRNIRKAIEPFLDQLQLQN